MGADFIGFILVGPKQIRMTEKQLRPAYEQARAVYEFAVKCQEPGFDPEAEIKKDKRLKHLPEWVTDDYAEELQDLAAEFDAEHPMLAPVKAVKTAIDVWNSGARDSQSRLLSFDHLLTKLKHGFKILVAGDMSWGDEPDGYGYQTMRKADKLGVLPFLKIG